MNTDEWVNPYTQKLENLLTTDFAAIGHDLAEKIGSIEANLPTELCDSLRGIAKHSRQTSETLADAAELVFRCGQVIERLEALRRSRIADSLSFAAADGSLSPMIWKRPNSMPLRALWRRATGS